MIIFKRNKGMKLRIYKIKIKKWNKLNKTNIFSINRFRLSSTLVQSRLKTLLFKQIYKKNNKTFQMNLSYRTYRKISVFKALFKIKIRIKTRIRVKK
jgi:hypothetical protein